jgi:hypothetical protein
MRNRILWMMIVTSSLLWLPWSAIAADDDAVNATNNAVDQGNQILDEANQAIDNPFQGASPQGLPEGNGQINQTIESVLDQNAQGSVGEAIGTFQNIGGLLSRIQSLGQKIEGLLSNFNLDELLDVASIQLDQIKGNIYGESGANNQGAETIASDPLAAIEAGELGLPPIDQVDEAIQTGGTTGLMEALGTKQQGGSSSGRTYLENLYRMEQTEETATQTALGEAGQKKLADNSIATNDALKTSTAMMEDSENQDVSQNVLRNISVQAHEQTVHTGLLALDAQLRARDDSMRNVLLERSLGQLQAERNAEQRRIASAYSDVITTGGGFYLPGLGDEEEQNPRGGN